MPLYHFICSSCSQTVRRILKPKEVAGLTCTKCGTLLTRDPKPPSSQVMERLDNGIMPRAIERLSNAEELRNERASRDPRHS